jgi:hypothetical protein
VAHVAAPQVSNADCTADDQILRNPEKQAVRDDSGPALKNTGKYFGICDRANPAVEDHLAAVLTVEVVAMRPWRDRRAEKYFACSTAWNWYAR